MPSSRRSSTFNASFHLLAAPLHLSILLALWQPPAPALFHHAVPSFSIVGACGYCIWSVLPTRADPAKTDSTVVVYFRARIIPFIAPYLPTSLGARLSNYTPLSSFSFTDQAAAGLSSHNFDLEENMGEGSSENRLGLDEAGVEEVRRIM